MGLPVPASYSRMRIANKQWGMDQERDGLAKRTAGEVVDEDMHTRITTARESQPARESRVVDR
jgi:hypothetical protein